MISGKSQVSVSMRGCFVFSVVLGALTSCGGTASRSDEETGSLSVYGEPSTLVDSEYFDGLVSVSSDGASGVFLSGRSYGSELSDQGKLGITVFNAADRNNITIRSLKECGSVSTAKISPDGLWLAFLAQESGAAVLKTMPVDGDCVVTTPSSLQLQHLGVDYYFQDSLAFAPIDSKPFLLVRAINDQGVSAVFLFDVSSQGSTPVVLENFDEGAVAWFINSDQTLGVSSVVESFPSIENGGLRTTVYSRSIDAETAAVGERVELLTTDQAYGGKHLVRDNVIYLAVDLSSSGGVLQRLGFGDRVDSVTDSRLVAVPTQLKRFSAGSFPDPDWELDAPFYSLSDIAFDGDRVLLLGRERFFCQVESRVGSSIVSVALLDGSYDRTAFVTNSLGQWIQVDSPCGYFSTVDILKSTQAAVDLEVIRLQKISGISQGAFYFESWHSGDREIRLYQDGIITEISANAKPETSSL